MKTQKVNFIFIIIICSTLLSSLYLKAEGTKEKNEADLIKYYEELLKTGLTDSQLNELFPVPEQWKNWYILEEQGKLPLNIHIESTLKDKNHRQYDKSNEMLFNKIRFYKEKLKGISYFESSIIKRGSHKKNNEEQTGLYLWLREHTLKRQYNPYLFKMYIQYLKKKYTNLDIITNLSISMKESILYVKKQPKFFKEELAYLRTFAPDLWKITEVAGNDLFSIKIKYAALGSLYLLDEDLNKIIKMLDRIKPENENLIFIEKLLFSDVVNEKTITFYDIRLKNYFLRSIESKNVNNQILAFEYFTNIGEQDSFVSQMVTFCKNHLDNDGLRIFQIFLNNKNRKEVKDLVSYYKENFNKVDEWSRSAYRNMLVNEFNIKVEDLKK